VVIKNDSGMDYVVVSYPEFSDNALDSIQNYRKEHDEWLYPSIDPHFSFVFPVSEVSETDFISEIVRLTQDIKKIDFVLRSAVVNKDSFNEYYHALLVPDDGFSRIVKLHDKLYSGLLKDELRLDIDYIPHIGVGNSTDKFDCKRMVDEWNAEEFAISGTISSLSIVSLEDLMINTLHTIPLK